LASGNHNSDGNGTLPHPELNPLLNPLLSAHMGRWAEVYFTTPPERRDEAVLELLQELQGRTTPPTRRASEKQAPPEPAKLHPSALPVEDANQEWSVCETCGGRNALGNKFCGMCASPLQISDGRPAQQSPRATMWALEELREAHEYERDIHAGQHSDLRPDQAEHETNRHETHRFETEQYEKYQPQQGINDFRESNAARIEPYTLQPNTWPARPDIPSLMPEYEQEPSRFRRYVGFGLAVLIGGLVYFAWHGTFTRSETSHQLPEPVPAIAAAQPAADPSLPPIVQTEPQDTDSKPATSAAAVPQIRNSTNTPSHMQGTSIAQAQPHAVPPRPAAPLESASDQAPTPIVATLQGNGSEELIVAESYLNGTRGRAQDSSEAAKWLWRSFGKKNGRAALLLSDLYLRGDGVPQSCDQARVLLDAATRNGAPGAAEKLKNLGSSGCQ
jgi:hypothetical protein